MRSESLQSLHLSANVRLASFLLHGFPIVLGSVSNSDCLPRVVSAHGLFKRSASNRVQGERFSSQDRYQPKKFYSQIPTGIQLHWTPHEPRSSGRDSAPSEKPRKSEPTHVGGYGSGVQCANVSGNSHPAPLPRWGKGGLWPGEREFVSHRTPISIRDSVPFADTQTPQSDWGAVKNNPVRVVLPRDRRPWACR